MSDLFDQAQTLFRQCLKLSRTTAERYINIEYECLLHLARIERLHKRTGQSVKTVVQQLLQALHLCYWSTNDASFIQTCYFELALMFLEQARLSNETARKTSMKSLTVVEPSSLLKQRSTVTTSMPTDPAKKQQLKQAAAVAIRAATQMAINQKHR